jgi:DNA-directed RNA polymerase specialized sigma24 family protein
MVRSIGMAQTLLSPQQVASVVALYEPGVSVSEVASRFDVHHTTVLAHLRRQSIPLRRTGLNRPQVEEATHLYRGGWTLMEIGLKFGVSQGAVRRALDGTAAIIRPRGRRPSELAGLADAP